MTDDPTPTLFAPSLLMGLSIAAPVGPIGLLTIQRTLAPGPAAGLATGLGAAVADAVYGAIGAFMLWMAWSTWRAWPMIAGVLLA